MELKELLNAVKALAQGVGEGLRGINEALDNTSRDSDPSKYNHLVFQKSILASAKSALADTESVIQQHIASLGERHQAPKGLVDSCECIRKYLECLSTTVVSGVAKNMKCQQ